MDFKPGGRGEVSQDEGCRRLEVLFEARHQLDEITGPLPRVELMNEDLVPSVFAGASRAREREKVRTAGTDPHSP